MRDKYAVNPSTQGVLWKVKRAPMALSGRCRPVDGRPVNRFPLGESLVALVGGKMLGEKLPGYSRFSASADYQMLSPLDPQRPRSWVRPTALGASWVGFPHKTSAQDPRIRLLHKTRTRHAKSCGNAALSPLLGSLAGTTPLHKIFVDL